MPALAPSRLALVRTSCRYKAIPNSAMPNTSNKSRVKTSAISTVAEPHCCLYRDMESSTSTTAAYFRRDYDATGPAAFRFSKTLSVFVHDHAGGNAVKSCDGSKVARRIRIIRLILYCESQRRTCILSEGDGMCTPCKSKKRQDA